MRVLNDQIIILKVLQILDFQIEILLDDMKTNTIIRSLGFTECVLGLWRNFWPVLFF